METGRSQAFLTLLGLEQIFAYEVSGHNHSTIYILKSQYPHRQLLNSKSPFSHLQAKSYSLLELRHYQRHREAQLLRSNLGQLQSLAKRNPFSR